MSTYAWFRPIRNKGTPKKKSSGKSLKHGHKKQSKTRRRGGMKSLKLNHRPGNLDTLVRELREIHRDVDDLLEASDIIGARNKKIFFENQVHSQIDPLYNRVLTQLVEDIQKKIEDKEKSLRKRKVEYTIRTISPSPKSQKTGTVKQGSNK